MFWEYLRELPVLGSLGSLGSLKPGEVWLTKQKEVKAHYDLEDFVAEAESAQLRCTSCLCTSGTLDESRVIGVLVRVHVASIRRTSVDAIPVSF